MFRRGSREKPEDTGRVAIYCLFRSREKQRVDFALDYVERYKHDQGSLFRRVPTAFSDRDE